MIIVLCAIPFLRATTSSPHIEGDDTGRQAPTSGGNRVNRRPSVNPAGIAPQGLADRTEQIRGSVEGSGLRTPTTSLNPPRPSVTVQNLQRVQSMLNNSAPALAETPAFVQLVGQVSEILQQTMQRTEAYREQRVSGSQTMTSSQRSSLSRGQHGCTRE